MLFVLVFVFFELIFLKLKIISLFTVDDDLSFGRAGPPTTICDLRLKNWSEGGYMVTNRPYPQGEVIIGGDSVSRGYYKLDEKTAEDFFDEDGRRWFKTGDIGEFHKDGVLKIIGKQFIFSRKQINIHFLIVF